MVLQVKKNHYNFSRYNHLKRWTSYWYQIHETLFLNIESVLEIGPGSEIVSFILKKEGLKYNSLDFSKDLHPDFVGDIRDFNLNKKFDMIMACQVLEHIPYVDFKKSLKNMAKHSKKYVIISLPYFGPHIKFNLEIFPLFNLMFSKKIFFPKKLEFDGEHYWEIGRKNYPLKRIVKDISEEFKIKKRFLLKENPYHYFFILEKLNK